MSRNPCISTRTSLSLLLLPPCCAKLISRSSCRTVAGMGAKVPHVIVFPFPAQGHVNGAMDLSRKLALLGVSITFVCTDAYIASMTKQGFDAGVPLIRLRGLPDGLPRDKNMTDALDQVDILIRATETMGPALEQLLCNLMEEEEGGGRISCVVYDFMLWWVAGVGKRLDIPAYIFYPMSSSFYSYCLHIPEFVSQGRLPLGPQSDLSDKAELFQIPGFPALHVSEVPDVSWDPNPVCSFDYLLRLAAHWRDANGVLLNTVYELEKEVIDRALRAKAPEMDIKAVGPVVPSWFLKGETSSGAKLSADAQRCLEWLDEQPAGSVVYIAFGTIASISEGQAEEIAAGLEASAERFLWVVRAPDQSMMMRRLLSGLEERSKGKGLVLWELAPQRLILANPAIGAFITHCGWNSVLEALCKGVPMICFPMFADQSMNAKWLADVLKTGTILQRSRDDGIVTRDEVIRALNLLSATDKSSSSLRESAARIRDMAARAALHPSGSSTQSLQAFVHMLLTDSKRENP